MSHDTWVHRLVAAGVAPLARTALRPNHLTMARLTTGIAAAILVGWGTREAQLWASALFTLSFILDRADGVLARLQGTTSNSGRLFDLIADAASNTLFFVALGIGLRHSFLGPWAALAGLIAGLAVLATFWLSARAERRTGSTRLRSFARIDADDAMIVAPIVIVFDYSLELLAAAAVGAPLFALAFAAVNGRAVWGALPERRATPAPRSTSHGAPRPTPRR
jgi:phosphatidylglycerophosphate synthase